MTAADGGRGSKDNARVSPVPDRRWLYLILTLSVLVRVAIAFYLGDVVDAPPLLTDQRSYDALARRLLAGHGYSFAENWYPFTMADAPTAHWSFLYPLFVAAVYGLFGPHPLAARLVQAVLGGLLLPWVVYRLSRRLFPGRESGHLIAAALAAFYGYFVLYAATLMTETFYIILLVWSIEVAVRLGGQLAEGRQPSVGLLLSLGLSLGLAALMRQAILPWVPLLVIWLLWRAGRRTSLLRLGARLAIPILVIAALILPWTYRNYRVYGGFLLLNSNSGYAMFSAQHPMHGIRFSEFAAAPIPGDLLTENEAEMDRSLLRLGLGFVWEEPIRYLLLSADRIRAYFSFWPSSETRALHNIGRVGSFGVLLPLLIYGCVCAARERLMGPGAWLIVGFGVFYTAMHVATWAMVRYRLPVDAVLLPWGGFAGADLMQHVGRLAATRRRLVSRGTRGGP